MQTQDLLLDKVNKQIIDALQINGRISNRDLAALIHLSPSACLKRTKKLEELGYIRNYTLSLNLDKTCANVMVIAKVNINPDRARAASLRFESSVKEIPFVVECFKVSGEADYMVHFICRHVQHYNQLIESLLAQNPDIANVNSHVIMSMIKSFSGYPLKELDPGDTNAGSTTPPKAESLV